MAQYKIKIPTDAHYNYLCHWRSRLLCNQMRRTKVSSPSGQSIKRASNRSNGLKQNRNKTLLIAETRPYKLTDSSTCSKNEQHLINPAYSSTAVKSITCGIKHPTETPSPTSQPNKPGLMWNILLKHTQGHRHPCCALSHSIPDPHQWQPSLTDNLIS